MSTAKTAIQSVVRYFESRNSTTEDDLVKLFQFKCKVEQESVYDLKQSNKYQTFFHTKNLFDVKMYV
jgi:ribosomal protein S26